MQLLHTALTALFSIIALFLVTKLLGYRQLAQLSTFDYINGITIGSIAAELATAQDEQFWEWTVALAVYAVVTLALSIATDRSICARRIISGRTAVLLDNGKMYDNNFRRAHLDIHEFLIECRRNGYFDLSQIQTAVLESNGTISFLPYAYARPVTPEDMAIRVPKDGVCANVILDGVVMEHNLKNIGFDSVWLQKQLKKKRCDVSDIFLAICSSEGVLTVFERAGKEHRDVWE